MPLTRIRLRRLRFPSRRPGRNWPAAIPLPSASIPKVEESLVFLYAEKSHNYLVSTEGTKIVTADAIFRIMIEAETRADDGMQLMRVETFQFSDPAKFPSEAEVAANVEKNGQ